MYHPPNVPVILVIYLSIVGLGLLLAITRRTTMLIRGQGFLILTVLSAAAGLLRPSLVAVWAAAVAVALLVPRWWLFLWCDRQSIAVQLESAFRMLLITAAPTGAGYTLKLSDGVVYIDLRTGPCHTAVLRLRQDRRHTKARLLRALLRKKFEPLFPRPKFRIR